MSRRKKRGAGELQRSVFSKTNWLYGSLLFFCCGCEYGNDLGPWFYNTSKYINHESVNANYAEKWFNEKYHETRTDWIQGMTFDYQPSKAKVDELCKIPASGCIEGFFFHLLIWDTSNDFIRCTTIQHEMGHMGAYMYGDHLGDPTHQENAEYFNKYIFEACNLILKGQS